MPAPLASGMGTERNAGMAQGINIALLLVGGDGRHRGDGDIQLPYRRAIVLGEENRALIQRKIFVHHLRVRA